MTNASNFKCVGITTMFRNNYGSILQCYATKHYIEEKGFTCVILERSWEDDNIIDKIRHKSKILAKMIRYPEFLSVRATTKRNAPRELSIISPKTQQLMDEFGNNEFSPKACNFNELKKIGRDESYIGFITGSDQVWNLGRSLEPFYFLEFTDKEKRYTLSPSFGIDRVPEFNKNDLRKKLLGFNDISIREESGKKIVEELTGKSAVRLADPTLLLSKEEWLEVGRNTSINNDNPYVLAHFLNEPSELAVQTMNKIAKKIGLNIIGIGFKHDKFKGLSNFTFVDGGPDTYLKYIDQAELICSDSFHTTLFSINLRKNFYTFERQYLHGFPQTSRIVDLLHRCGLASRLISSDILPEMMISWEQSEEIIEQERLKIRNYVTDGILNIFGRQGT